MSTEPAPNPAPALRASDADRERTVQTLSAHAGDGRLTVDELAERTDAAYSATTMPELDRLLADLPALPAAAAGAAPAPEEQEIEAHFREHLATYVLVNLLLVGIWAATGAGYFWPIFPILGWGVAVALDFVSTRNDTRRLRATPDPEARAAIVARNATRRQHHGHGHGRGGPHRLPRPPRPPRA